jgi:hypothetical protein
MIGSPLPNAAAANVESAKITAYLLNLAHPKGGPKAKFFRGRGFSPEQWEAFADALRHHAKHNLVVQIKSTFFGVNYSLDCHLPTPNQSSPCIRSVWEVRPEDPRPRLITAHPLGS